MKSPAFIFSCIASCRFEKAMSKVPNGVDSSFGKLQLWVLSREEYMHSFSTGYGVWLPAAQHLWVSESKTHCVTPQSFHCSLTLLRDWLRRKFQLVMVSFWLCKWTQKWKSLIEKAFSTCSSCELLWDFWLLDTSENEADYCMVEKGFFLHCNPKLVDKLYTNLGEKEIF